jgi:hypothetical protein
MPQRAIGEPKQIGRAKQLDGPIGLRGSGEQRRQAERRRAGMDTSPAIAPPSAANPERLPPPSVVDRNSAMSGPGVAASKSAAAV